MVSGIATCCENDNAKNQTFNFTFGNAREVNEMVEILKKEFPKVNIIYREKEIFMPERGTLKNNKAKTLLGFEPQYPIEVGYPKYIQWYKSFWNSSKWVF